MNFPIPWKMHRIFPSVSLSGGVEEAQRLLVYEVLRGLAMSQGPGSSYGQQDPAMVGSPGCSFKAINHESPLSRNRGEEFLQDLLWGGEVHCSLGQANQAPCSAEPVSLS